MKVSIITPFYYGNAYMSEYERMMYANAGRLSEGDEIEVILVNDSPTEEINMTPRHTKKLHWTRVSNDKNLGIHASRLRGLSEATGEYVIFLDQDDVLAKDAVATFLNEAKKPHGSGTVFVANAALEQADGSVLKWYRRAYHTACLNDLMTYVTVGTQIISPGQCMLPRKLIPKAWKRHVLKTNGADDYCLWLLLLHEGAYFTYVDALLYKHRYTAHNISADTTVTDVSTEEFIGFLEEDDFPKKYCRLLRRQTRYKAAFRRAGGTGKVVHSVRNGDLFLKNVYYKLRTHTGYGFNR